MAAKRSAVIEFVPVASIKPSPRNARTHGPEQLKEIEASIVQFGWTMPMLIEEDGTIIAGHGRETAAQVIYAGGGSIRMADGSPIPKNHVPAIIPRGWTDQQKRAYALADNKIPLNAGWDPTILRSELTFLKANDFNLQQLGFTDIELVSFMAAPPSGEDPEATPEPTDNPVSRPGDLWVLGNHRILCGDSTNAEDVERSLDGSKPKIMVTDPPYGVNYNPKWRDELGIDWTGQVQRKKSRAVVKSLKSRSLGKVKNDDRADWTEAWKLFDGVAAYVWHGGLHAGEVQQSLEAAGLMIRCQIIWVKQHFVFSRGDYHWQHEPCWYAVRKGESGGWTGDRKQTTTWQIQNASAFKGDKGDGLTGHGTQKPIECMRRPILNNSRPGDVVYEPFAGSGTTIIAAEMENRACRAIELSPTYVDVCVRRWQTYAKATATLAGDGRSFQEIEAERTGKPKHAKGDRRKPVQRRKRD